MFLVKRRIGEKKAKITDSSPKKLALKKKGGNETVETTNNFSKQPVSNPSIDETWLKVDLGVLVGYVMKLKNFLNHAYLEDTTESKTIDFRSF